MYLGVTVQEMIGVCIATGHGTNGYTDITNSDFTNMLDVLGIWNFTRNSSPSSTNSSSRESARAFEGVDVLI